MSRVPHTMPKPGMNSIVRIIILKVHFRINIHLKCGGCHTIGFPSFVNKKSGIAFLLSFVVLVTVGEFLGGPHAGPECIIQVNKGVY